MSKEFTTFPNAPIAEAVLDIRAELSEDVQLEDLESFQNDIIERFPEKKKRTSYEGGFQFSEDGISTLPTNRKDIGYRFGSPTEKKVVQARLDGFSFNKLRPYESWSLFCKEGQELWDLYSKMYIPIKITRIALRYINRMEIPLPMNDFEDYILTFPQIAPKLPQGIANFIMQLVIPNKEIEASAMITLAMEEIKDDKLPLIFDIDVSKGAVYMDNKDEVWSAFNDLRVFKNEIFFDSITDKTKELFK
jgi:uncharacterized protein (TIGR04255 family)